MIYILQSIWLFADHIRRICHYVIKPCHMFNFGVFITCFQFSRDSAVHDDEAELNIHESYWKLKTDRDSAESSGTRSHAPPPSPSQGKNPPCPTLCPLVAHGSDSHTRLLRLIDLAVSAFSRDSLFLMTQQNPDQTSTFR